MVSGRQLGMHGRGAPGSQRRARDITSQPSTACALGLKQSSGLARRPWYKTSPAPKHLGGVCRKHQVDGLAAQRGVNVLGPHLHPGRAAQFERVHELRQPGRRKRAAVHEMRRRRGKPATAWACHSQPLLWHGCTACTNASYSTSHAMREMSRWARTCSLLTRRCSDLLVERVAASTSPRRAACTREGFRQRVLNKGATTLRQQYSGAPHRMPQRP